MTCFMGHFESVFRALFSFGIYIVNKQDSKNMFLNNFDFMVKSLYPNPGRKSRQDQDPIGSCIL